MHPDIAQAVARAHVDDLHREAARRRLVAQAAGRGATRAAVRRRWSALVSAAGARLSRPPIAEQGAGPDCCPA